MKTIFGIVKLFLLFISHSKIKLISKSKHKNILVYSQNHFGAHSILKGNEGEGGWILSNIIIQATPNTSLLFFPVSASKHCCKEQIYFCEFPYNNFKVLSQICFAAAFVLRKFWRVSFNLNFKLSKCFSPILIICTML